MPGPSHILVDPVPPPRPRLLLVWCIVSLQVFTDSLPVRGPKASGENHNIGSLLKHPEQISECCRLNKRGIGPDSPRRTLCLQETHAARTSTCITLDLSVGSHLMNGCAFARTQTRGRSGKRCARKCVILRSPLLHLALKMKFDSSNLWSLRVPKTNPERVDLFRIKLPMAFIIAAIERAP